MFAQFKSHIKTQTGLSDEEIALICSRATSKTLRRKEFLLHEGELCRYKTFVSKGFLRTYRTTANGNLYTMQFSPENSWTTDHESYNNSTPSCYNIDALEPSEVLMWTKKDFDYLFKKLPQLKAYSEHLISGNCHRGRQRVFNAISATAEEKYDDFIKTHPGILTRVPLHMVASFLGLSRETLSRIRHEKVKS